jgi:hypothetical protein
MQLVLSENLAVEDFEIDISCTVNWINLGPTSIAGSDILDVEILARANLRTIWMSTCIATSDWM